MQRIRTFPRSKDGEKGWFRVVAGKIARRALCDYPRVARYKGSGSVDEAANFACEALI